MPLSLTLASRASGTQPAATTAYTPVVWGGGGSVANTSEAAAQVIFSFATTLRRASLRVITNGTSLASFWRTRINGVNGNLTFSIGAGLTGTFEDLINEDVVAASDLVACALTTSGTGTIALPGLVVESDAASYHIGSMNSITLTTASTTYWFLPVTFQNAALSTTEAIFQMKWVGPGTLKKFAVWSTTNSRTDTTVLKTRVNGADGGQSVNVATTATGLFQDTSGSDAVVAGDLVNGQVTLGAGTGSIVFNHWLEWHSPTVRREWHSGRSSGTTTATALVRYHSLSGLSQAFTTESQAQTRMNSLYRLSLLRVRITVNSISPSSSSVAVRKNAVDGNLTVTIAASTSGLFEDNANVDEYAAGDNVNYRFTTGGSTGSLDISYLSVAADNLERPLRAPVTAQQAISRASFF